MKSCRLKLRDLQDTSPHGQALAGQEGRQGRHGQEAPETESLIIINSQALLRGSQLYIHKIVLLSALRWFLLCSVSSLRAFHQGDWFPPREGADFRRQPFSLLLHKLER